MPVADTQFILDTAAIIEQRRSLLEQVAGIDPRDLPRLTNEVFDRLDDLADGIDDATVVLVPEDPQADPDEGAPWTFGHVIVHLTAGLEENAALGNTLARGAEVTGRPRYETPWEQVTTAERVRQRLAESRRMTLALLDGWPDAPHLDNVHEHAYFGTANAVAYHLLGIAHAQHHLGQLAAIRRQAGLVAV